MTALKIHVFGPGELDSLDEKEFDEQFLKIEQMQGGACRKGHFLLEDGTVLMISKNSVPEDAPEGSFKGYEGSRYYIDKESKQLRPPLPPFFYPNFYILKAFFRKHGAVLNQKIAEPKTPGIRNNGTYTRLNFEK